MRTDIARAAPIGRLEQSSGFISDMRWSDVGEDVRGAEALQSFMYRSISQISAAYIDMQGQYAERYHRLPTKFASNVRRS